jgi:hypothetical protein
MCNVVAFSIVLYNWSRIFVSKNYHFQISKVILVGFICVNIIATIAGVIDLCKLSNSKFPILIISLGIIGSYFKYVAESQTYEVIVITNSVSLLLLCITMISYGYVVKNKLDVSLRDIFLLQDDQTLIENSKKLALLRRILSLLSICAMCFLIRVVCLCGVLYDVSTTGTDITDQIPLVVWFILSSWVPTIIPVSMFLFIFLSLDVISLLPASSLTL